MLRLTMYVSIFTSLIACGGPTQSGSELSSPGDIAPLSHFSRHNAVSFRPIDAESEFDGFCSGILIKHDLVATARHCLEGKEVFWVNFNGEDGGISEATTTIGIAYSRLPFGGNIDIGLLKLLKPDAVPEHFEPATLIDAETAIDEDSQLLSAGWGVTTELASSLSEEERNEIRGNYESLVNPAETDDAEEEEEISEFEEVAATLALNDAMLRLRTSFEDNPGMLRTLPTKLCDDRTSEEESIMLTCTGIPWATVGPGDSGGPLYLKQGESHVLAGIARSSNFYDYSAFVDVRDHLDWIEESNDMLDIMATQALRQRQAKPEEERMPLRVTVKIREDGEADFIIE